MTDLPLGWGDYPLTQYLQDFRGNQLATFNEKRSELEKLTLIDQLFMRVGQGAINPRPQAPMIFMHRSHSAYRSSVSAVLGGQVYEAQALLRLTLEHAAYGLYINDNDRRWALWKGRSSSKKAKENCRDEFLHGKVCRYMKGISRPIGERYVELYERLIDFGAHPNERGVIANTLFSRPNGDLRIDTVQLQPDGAALNFGLDSCAAVGTWALHAFRLVYPERFRLLDAGGDLDRLRAGA